MLTSSLFRRLDMTLTALIYSHCHACGFMIYYGAASGLLDTWLNVNERIEYKLLSLTYKLLTTSQPDYLHNLISVQSTGRTRSSSLVNLARPSVSSSLQITNYFFLDMHHLSLLVHLILHISPYHSHHLPDCLHGS